MKNHNNERPPTDEEMEWRLAVIRQVNHLHRTGEITAIERAKLHEIIAPQIQEEKGTGWVRGIQYGEGDWNHEHRGEREVMETTRLHLPPSK